MVKISGNNSPWLPHLLVAMVTLSNVNGQVIDRFQTLNDRLTVSWTVDMAKETVTFVLTAQTKGFIGFGLSPQGGMDNADVIIGGVDDSGNSYFTDRFATGKKEPKIDDSQDWSLLEAYENETYTVLRFSRPFDTCDDAEDLPINDDTTKFIWSLGATDDIAQHAERGASSVNILDPYTPPVDTTQFDTWEIKVNTIIPTQDTTYWCTAHRTPAKYTQKRHVVGFKVKLDSEEARTHNHHMILHQCKVKPGSPEEAILEAALSEPGGACYDDDGSGMDLIQNLCQTYMYVWAAGGDPLFLPENVGFPINTLGSVEYFLLEIHYDNPKVLVGVQYDTGLDVYTTDKLREVDAGLLIVGHAVSSSMIVPPSSQNYVISGHCSSRCTQEKMNETGINVINVLLHSHLSGRKLKLRHFRPDETVQGKFTELPWIAYDNHYDFNYQQNRPLRNPLKVLPGDHLTYECTYDSTWRDPPSTTLGGLSTRHEMCESFLMYYPAMSSLENCFSDVADAIHSPLNITQLDYESDFRDPIILAPDYMSGLNLSTVLDTITDWTPEFRTRFQDLVLNGEHYDGCWSSLEEAQTFTKFYSKMKTSESMVKNENSIKEEIFMVSYPKNFVPYKPQEKDCSNGVSSSRSWAGLSAIVVIVVGFICIIL